MASPILFHFKTGHLPQHLAEVSDPFCKLAHHVDEHLPNGAEKSTALRKLLEAKDAAVRAAVEAQQEDSP